jgi:hypothetical protein
MGARRPRSGMAGRLPMRSPGRPPVARREHRQRFWEAIAHGLSSEDAAVVCGYRRRWGAVVPAGWRHAITSLAPLSGRYLWFTEREEITVLKAQGCGVREIARRVGRSASTISREDAATPRPAAGCWSIGPRPRSGTRIGVPSARSWPSSPATTRSGNTGRTGSPAGAPRPTARRCPVPRFAGSGGVTGAARTGAGPGRGVRSRSPTGSGSTSPMMVHADLA